MKYKSIPSAIVYTVLLVLVIGIAPAQKTPTARKPADDSVPVCSTLRSAREFLKKARTSPEIYAADLSRAQKGQILRAQSEKPLPPGRYRLHALVASHPHGTIIVDAVELRLQANGARASFNRKRHFPKPGKLGHVAVDFQLEKEQKARIKADWFVGDTMLEVGGKKKWEARRIYRARRENAIIKRRQKGQSIDAMVGHGGDDGLTEDLSIEDEPQKLRKRSVEDSKLPEYRLMLGGLVIERLNPVQLIGVTTQPQILQPQQTAQPVVTLRNLSTDPATTTLSVGFRDAEDDEPTGELLSTEVTLKPEEKRKWKVDKTLNLGGVRQFCELTATLEKSELRPQTKTSLLAILPSKQDPPDLPKKAFAHYMGCWPVATGPILWQLKNIHNNFSHQNSGEKGRYGGHVRNFPLVPPDMSLSLEESVDLEIRRALRMGLDGFAIDAWAGSNDAKNTLNAMFKVAEEKDYPFEITICLDPACGGWSSAVKYLMERHGDSPKLARRDGRPLIFGYLTGFHVRGRLRGKYPDLSDKQRLSLLAKPEGWKALRELLQEFDRAAGERCYYHIGMQYFFHQVPAHLRSRERTLSAVRAFASFPEVGAIGAFSHTGYGSFGSLLPKMARAVRESGAEWECPIGMYQKENIPYEMFGPKGTEWIDRCWNDARKQNSTLLQLVTWNDYGENTMMAPAWNTRYTFYDLTRYYLQWWKTGAKPRLDRDRMYLSWQKYPEGSKVWPFDVKFHRKGAIEVLTFLKKPALVRLPGRDVEYEAPAGKLRRQFPLTPGPIVAEIVRDGKVVRRLESPEPVTDRPFRGDNGLTCISTEFERHWRADFGDTPIWHYSEYGDADDDGLPNWFEMYWFGKWLDFSTMTDAEPDADPDEDGKTNREEYLARTDPTLGHVSADPAELEKEIDKEKDQDFDLLDELEE